MLACCISGCVSVNRFGFAIEGARCALDRFYYDSLNGQLKPKPRWEGFQNATNLLDNINTFLGKLPSVTLPTDCTNFVTQVFYYRYEKIYTTLNSLKTTLDTPNSATSATSVSIKVAVKCAKK